MDCSSFWRRFVAVIIKLWYGLALESDHDGNTALHLACVQGDLDVVKTVVECHPKLCLKKNKDKRIPLHIAVMNGRDDLVRELLSACPDSIKVLTLEEQTVFHVAAQCPLPNVFEVLWEEAKKHDKDYLLDRVDYQGNSLLHYAVLYNKLWIVKTCQRGTIDNGIAIRVNTKNNEGHTAMDLYNMILNPGSETEQIGNILKLASENESHFCQTLASETNTEHLTVLTIFIGSALAVICALPSFFPKEGSVAIAQEYEFKDALYGELPLIFYLMFFVTVPFTISICTLIVILFSLRGRTFMLISGISTFCLYFLLTRLIMPKFSVRARPLLVPSYYFMWVLVLAFIFIGALIIHLGIHLMKLSYNHAKLLLRKVASIFRRPLSNQSYDAREMEMSLVRNSS